MRRIIAAAVCALVLASCDSEDPCLEDLESATRLVLQGVTPYECGDLPPAYQEPCVGLAFARECLEDGSTCDDGSAGEVPTLQSFDEALEKQLQCLENR